MGRILNRSTVWLLFFSLLALLVSTHSARASVALVSFDVATSADGNGVEIRWVTGTEQDTSAFLVKRTTDPEKYLEVAEGQEGRNPQDVVKATDDIIEVENEGRTEQSISARGNVSAGAEYLVYDRSAEVGTTYYYMLVEIESTNAWQDVSTDKVTVGEKVTPETNEGLIVVPTTDPNAPESSTATPSVDATPTEEGGNAPTDTTDTTTDTTETATETPVSGAEETTPTDEQPTEIPSADATETPIPTPTEIGAVAEPTAEGVEGEEAASPSDATAEPGVQPTKTLRPLDTPTPSPTSDPNRSAEDATATAEAPTVEPTATLEGGATSVPSAPIEEIDSPEQPTPSFPDEAMVTATPEPGVTTPAEEPATAPDGGSDTNEEPTTDAAIAPAPPEEATVAPGDQPESAEPTQQPTPAPIGVSLPTATPESVIAEPVVPTEQAQDPVGSDPVATEAASVEQPVVDPDNSSAEQPTEAPITSESGATTENGNDVAQATEAVPSDTVADNNSSAEATDVSGQPEEIAGVPDAGAQEVDSAYTNVDGEKIASNPDDNRNDNEQPGKVVIQDNATNVTSSGDLPPPSRIGQDEKESGTNPLIWAGFIGAVLVFGAGAAGSIMLFTRRQQKE